MPRFKSVVSPHAPCCATAGPSRITSGRCLAAPDTGSAPPNSCRADSDTCPAKSGPCLVKSDTCLVKSGPCLAAPDSCLAAPDTGFFCPDSRIIKIISSYHNMTCDDFHAGRCFEAREAEPSQSHYNLGTSTDRTSSVSRSSTLRPSTSASAVRMTRWRRAGRAIWTTSSGTA